MSMLKFAFLTLALSVAVQGHPGSPKKSSDFYDYYADEYSDYSSDDDYLTEDERVVHTIPKFVSREVQTVVNEGDTIKLPCFVDKLDGYTLLWQKDGNILALGNQVMERSDTRRKVQAEKDGNTLVISLAEASDAGHYDCQISANKPTYLRHIVDIRVEPVIVPVPANGLVVVNEGDMATLECNVTKGTPQPRVTWNRKTRKLPSGEDVITAQSLSFYPVTRHHSGVYFCNADNGFGPNPVKAEIKLDVQHAPIVDQEQTFIHTHEDDVETEVVCIVHASPRAKVTWYKNGEPLQGDQGIVTHHNNRHTLLLPGIIKKSKYGVYTCRAENKFGVEERTTEVSGHASPASFKTNPQGSDDSSYHLEWVTESITPVTVFSVRYRPAMTASSEAFEEVEVLPRHHGDHLYAGSLTLQGLQAATLYETQVASKNLHGFSRFNREPFLFGTLGADFAGLNEVPTGAAKTSSDHQGPIHEPSTAGGPQQQRCSFISILSSVQVLVLLRRALP